MFRSLSNIPFGEYGGAAAAAVLSDYVESGQLPVLQNVTDLDYYVEGAIVLADLLLADHMRGMFGDILDGAAVYSAGDIVGKLIGKYVTNTGSKATSTSTTTGTGATADYIMSSAPAAIQAPVFGSTPSFGADF